MSSSVLVFTRDLRVTDNPALAAAAADGEHTVPLFVFDDALLARCGDHANRLGFLLESLHDLDRSLHERGGALVVRRGGWVQAVIAVARDAGAGSIHVADDYPGYAAGRLTRLEKAAAAAGLPVHRHPGITVVPPGAVSPPSGPAYQVVRLPGAAGRPPRGDRGVPPAAELRPGSGSFGWLQGRLP